MNIKTVLLENTEYYVIEKLLLQDILYYFLVNTNDEYDFCVRKEKIENNEKYLVGLDNELEFDYVMQMYQNKSQSI